MISFLHWVDTLPPEIFNLSVIVLAGVIRAFTFFAERTWYATAATAAGLERDLGVSGFCTVCGLLREPVLLELDAESAQQLVDTACLEQPGAPVR